MNSKIKSIFVILTLVIIASSCSSNSNSTGGNFTLKYEIITSSPVTEAPTGGFCSILYTNGTQQVETGSSFSNGTTWTKEVTVTTPNRPFIAQLQPSGIFPGICLSAPGNVTCNIYVNGSRVAQNVSQTITSGTFSYAIISMNHYIQ